MKTMIHTNNKVLKTFHLATVTCVVTTLLMTVFGGWRPGSQWAHLMTSPQLVPMPAQRCDVLTNMLRGHWQQHNMTAEETLRMRKFYYSKPKNRSDKRCGNLTDGRRWFRALCDEEGDTPCCFNNVCVNKTASQCTCSACYDLRRTVVAEHATWRPADATCETVAWLSVEEMCRLLKEWRLVLIGDSLMRHVYRALLMEVRVDEGGALKRNVTAEVRARCRVEYMFVDKKCRGYLDRAGRVCNGTARVAYVANYKISHRVSIQRLITSSAKRPRSLAFFGMGIHERFDADRVQRLVLEPVLEELKALNLPRHRLLWAAHAAPGLRKPDGTTQSYDSVVKFNRRINAFMKVWQVPIFDVFNLTDGVRSFDSTHYATGVNKLIVHMLFLYLRELDILHKW